jgi:hypothetical protein
MSSSYLRMTGCLASSVCDLGYSATIYNYLERTLFPVLERDCKRNLLRDMRLHVVFK